MSEITVKIISSAFATLGFSLLFKANLRHLPAMVAGGTMTAAIYLYLNSVRGVGMFVSSFLAVASLAILAEILARVFRAPTAIFLRPGGIILFPGSRLYYTMSYLIQRNTELAKENGMAALLIGLGIAGGMIAGSVVCGTISRAIDKWHLDKLLAGKK